ncbi:MAG: DUF2269 family protein [Gammaproteobacteria bacterium]
MGTLYTVLKFVHILIAILALGTSAGLGIVLEFYGQHPKHGPFVLGAITRISIWLVLPGYLAILATGLWMTHLVWTPVPGWLQTAMAVWCVGLMILIADLAVLRKQVAMAADGGNPGFRSNAKPAMKSSPTGGGSPEGQRCSGTA